ncbi:MAG: glycosyltransferase family 4 protein [Candidatus Cloacimonadales bacterium]
MRDEIVSSQILRRFTFEEWGGTETVVFNSSKQLQKKGHPTEILATKALCSKQHETVEGLQIRRFDYFYPYLNLNQKNQDILDKKGGNPYSPQLYKYLLQKPELQILHCHTMQRLANTVRRVAQKRNIPYVISFHGGFFEVPQSEIAEMMQPLKHSFNYGKIFDLIHQNSHFLSDADGIICVGYNEYLTTKAQYPDKLVEYLPNAVDIEKFEAIDNNDFREKHQIESDAEILLCVSRIDYQKNQIRIIDLQQRLKKQGEKVHTLLIGPVTSQKYLAQIQQRIEQFDLAAEVTIIPGLAPDDADLTKAFLTADYFILPSIHEPFGIVALEAWASKLPVIAHHVGGLQKLISDGATGLFFHQDDLDELVEKFYEMRQRKSEIIPQAYQEVCDQYSWETITDRLINFYKRVIAKQKER